jgi:hypothetical protein
MARGKSSVDICRIYIFNNHSYHFYTAADVASRSLMGAFAGFSEVATIRGLIVLAFDGRGIAGFFAFYNMESANCRFVLSCLSCMVDYAIHASVSNRDEVRAKRG